MKIIILHNHNDEPEVADCEKGLISSCSVNPNADLRTRYLTSRTGFTNCGQPIWYMPITMQNEMVKIKMDVPIVSHEYLSKGKIMLLKRLVVSIGCRVTM